jgi:protein phosphatase
MFRHPRPRPPACRATSRVHVEAHGRTDIGGRETNQDHFLIAAIEPRLRVAESSVVPAADREVRPAADNVRYLFAVADGMGGQAAGECASRLVMDTISRRIVAELQPFQPAERTRDSTPVPRLVALMDECQQALRQRVRERPDERGLGTTLTLAYVAWPTAYIVHAGDSRAYLIRDNQARQLTTDHTVAHQLSEASNMGGQTVPSRWDHVLWNVIGGDGHSLKPESVVLDLADGDYLLLCTDGLTRGLSDDDLNQIVNRREELAERVHRLVDTAKASDGRDNITVIAARFDAPPAAHQRTLRRRARRTETWPSIKCIET